ncbi:hypothetical protein PVK06_009626 [Gossypium arboreum]|uniref:Uncharacterized protein n=1 Tax=Gossypium arboreum TaxID=29729 RepID=A0ABR0QP35_GOSAR|nr:hypothetical protein PVK06_009626 [Gossypium arboreum]
MLCLLNASGEHVSTNEKERFLLHETLTNSKITIDRTEIIDGGIKLLDKINAHPAPAQHRVELLIIGSSISGLNMLDVVCQLLLGIASQKQQLLLALIIIHRKTYVILWNQEIERLGRLHNGLVKDKRISSCLKR